MKNDTRVTTQMAETTIGLDVGDRLSHYCKLTACGEVAERGEVKSEQRALTELFKGMPRSRVVLEVGTHSPWISQLLQPWHEVVVANAHSARALMKGRRKNDRTDAELLARLGRADVELLRPVHHGSPQVQQDRAVLELRDGLVGARTKLVNQLRGILKSQGYRLSAKSYRTIDGSVAELPEGLQKLVQPTLAAIRALSESIGAADKEIERLSKERYPVTKCLRQVPGVGPIIALSFALVIEDPGRFKRSREVGAYLGLAPKQRDSGDQHPQPRISKAGDRMLRWLLVQGAHHIVGRYGPDSDLKRWAEARLTTGGANAKKRTIVAVARKLAVLLHHLWVTGEVYEPLYQANRRAALPAAA